MEEVRTGLRRPCFAGTGKVKLRFGGVVRDYAAEALQCNPPARIARRRVGFGIERESASVILDIDATYDVAHGHQKLSLFQRAI